METILNILPFRVSLRQLGVGLLLLGALFVYSIFGLLTKASPLVFNSPDETVNYFFASRLVGGESLQLAEPLNQQVNNVIHPRATVAADQVIRPVSFLGFIFGLGGLGSLFGLGILPFVTPLLSALTLLALYGWWKERWGERLAILATTMAASHGAVIYYSSRGLYHNVLFLDLIILAMWGYTRWRSTNKLDWFLFWLLLGGTALLVRTSEIWWLGTLMVLGLWSGRALIARRDKIVIGVTAITGLLGLGMLARIYSITSLTGYHGTTVGPSGEGLRAIGRIILPFGWHPVRAVINFWQYDFLLFWPVAVFIILGLIVYVRSANLPNQTDLKVASFITFWLVLFYGSAQINDSIGLAEITVGNSYVRYWLPIYIVWLPWAAMGVDWLASRYWPLQRQFITWILLLGLASFGLGQAFFDRSEGLVSVIQRVATYRGVRLEAMRLTGESAIILSDKADKIFWPDRRVITPGDRPFHTYPEVMQALPRLADTWPVYYYSTKMTPQIEAELAKVNIVVGQPKPLLDGAWLYPLISL